MDSVVHLGAHKTASTHLQIALQRAQAQLQALGLGVFTPRHLRAPELGLQDYVTRAADDPARIDHAARLRAAFAATATRRLVVTEENILGNAHDPELMRHARFYPRAEAVVPRVMELLPDGACTLALAIRDPASFLVSAYSQRLMSGAPDAFDAFLSGLDPRVLSWADLVERLRRAAPRARIIVWRFEDYPAVAPAVLAAILGREGAAQVRLDSAVAHPGLSALAHAALMSEADALRARGRAEARNRAMELREALPKGPAAPAFDPFAPELKAESAQAYRADIRRLTAIDGVRLISLADGVE